MKKLFEFLAPSALEFAPYPIAKGEEEGRVKRAILSNINKRCKWAAPGQEIGRGSAQRTRQNHA
jgi:hypothetical protein